ncbi:MAG: diguanylate cyclase [Candidatus Sumerlaeota bacterium]|nr:diguanylate cyclase [Candidatus Sumerlaeota bacterium]
MAMRRRIWVAAVACAALILALAGVVIFTLAKRQIEEAAAAGLESAHSEMVRSINRALEDTALLAYLSASSKNSSANFAGRARFKALSNTILRSSFGKSGHWFVMDGHGALVVSELDENTSILDRKDATGRPYIKEICDRKTGRAVYMIRETGARAPQRRIFLYSHIPETDWIAVATCGMDEFAGPIRTLRIQIAIAMALLAFLAIPLSLWLSVRLTRPLNAFIKKLISTGAADSPSAIMYEAREDEIAALSRGVNRLIERFQQNTDLLQRKSAEHEQDEIAIEKQREFLRQIIDADPNLIFSKDRHGRYTLVNQALVAIYGLEKERILGRTDDELARLAPKVKRKRAEDVMVIDTLKEQFIPEEEIVGADGQTRWFQTILRPIANEEGRMEQVLGVAADITKRKAAEKALLDAQSRLERRVEERTAALQTANQDMQREVQERARIEGELQKTNHTLSASVRELEQRSHEISLLNQMGDMLQSCQNRAETYAVFQDIAGKLFSQEQGMLCVMSDSQDALETVCRWGKAGSDDGLFAPDDCWALRRGKTHVVLSPATPQICPHLPSAPPHGYLCAPLFAQGEALGLFHLQWSEADAKQPAEIRAPLLESRQRLAAMVAEQFALALANLKLRETLRRQSIRDPLTGIFNRRYMEESLERELRRAERRQKPMGVVMLDVDHFKQFNDQFGHDAGDSLLRELGALLQKHIRKEDIACRFGGEEFVLILPESSLENTERRAEQLRQTVRAHFARANASPRPVTISLGMAIFPDHGLSGAGLIHAADTALYEAKTAGRDRCVVAKKSDDAPLQTDSR